MVQRLKSIDAVALRMVSLHLGNGASACAIELGHSTETSVYTVSGLAPPSIALRA